MLIEDLGLTNFQNIRPDAKELKAEDPRGELNQTEPDMCCALRKVRPLDGVLEIYDARITGRKRYQTRDRANMPIMETGGPNAVFITLTGRGCRCQRRKRLRYFNIRVTASGLPRAARFARMFGMCLSLDLIGGLYQPSASL